MWAVVVAAGAGARLGRDLPKAFVPLEGRPLLAATLVRLAACQELTGVVVAAPRGWEQAVATLAAELGVALAAVVPGAETRPGSVRVALEAVPEDAGVVVVHDAARPLLEPDVLTRVLGPLREGFDGVVPALPVADTVKRAKQGVVAETIERDGLVAVQTPQAFRASVLREAHSGDNAGATDCAGLVERCGGRVAVVPGDRRLLKVTDAEDLALVATWLRG